MNHRAKQIREDLARYYIRFARHLRGVQFPDLRDQDLRDRGLELQWRAGVLRREARR